MDGTRVLVVALLLCVAPIGGVVADSAGSDVAGSIGGDVAGSAGVDVSDPPQQTVEAENRSMIVFTADNTSEYLAPPASDLDRTDDRTTGLDVAGAVEIDGGGLESAYLVETLERRYAAADSDAERRAAIEDGVATLEQQVVELSARERIAIERYNDGAIGTDELLRTLTVVSRSAEMTAASLEWAEETASVHGMDAKAERAATARVRLVPMGGPLRAELADAITGEASVSVHVETAGDGIVLASIDREGDTYLREAHDPNARADEIGDQYGGNPSPALDRFTELYPWTIQSFDGIDAIGPEQVRLYRFAATHSHGELETYLDSGSTNILHERQRIRPESAPKTTLRRTQGDLTVVLNVTRPGGPLAIAVRDATSGEPVAADVELNGVPVGTTDDRAIWTVAPRGATTINASHADETVSFETRFG